MLNPIPIVPLTDFVCVIVLLFLNVHLHKRVMESPIPSLKAFRDFFVCVTIEMFFLSLIGTIVTNPYAMQAVANLATFVFYFVLYFFLCFIFISTMAGGRLIYKIIPMAVLLTGCIIFLWNMIAFLPSRFENLSLSKVSLIFFSDASPFLTNVVTGFFGFMVFGLGVFLFFKNGINLKEPVLKRRSLLISLGCATAIATSVFNWVFVYVFESLLFNFFAAVGALVSVLLVYSGALMRVK